MESQQRLSLSIALRRYWGYLIGIFAFPSVFIIGGNTLHIPAPILIAGFVAAFILAVWPCVFFKVPLTYALVAFAAWVVGIFLAVMLSIVVHVVGKLTAGSSQSRPAAQSFAARKTEG